MLNSFQHPCRAVVHTVYVARERNPCTYILASQKGGTLYVGVTSDLASRLWRHSTGTTPGFASRYGAIRLVYAEFFDRMDDAIAREKQLKRWHRAWKVNLIEADNPDWRDLAIEWSIAERKRKGP
jgi:putative endonuclease